MRISDMHDMGDHRECLTGTCPVARRGAGERAARVSWDIPEPPHKPLDGCGSCVAWHRDMSIAIEDAQRS
jgi:hypothetical protein